MFRTAGAVAGPGGPVFRTFPAGVPVLPVRVFFMYGSTARNYRSGLFRPGPDIPVRVPVYPGNTAFDKSSGWPNPVQLGPGLRKRCAEEKDRPGSLYSRRSRGRCRRLVENSVWGSQRGRTGLTLTFIIQ
jgi:hypothetical protein